MIAITEDGKLIGKICKNDKKWEVQFIRPE